MNITVKDLLDAGVHFGHQVKRWNPRSKPYIFDHRQGISIIDLGHTFEALEKACSYVEELVANGGNILLVGTKRQAQEIVREAASSTGMPFCVNRWLGGTLTNFETIKRSIAKYKRYQAMDTSGDLAKLPKKEESAIRREMARMHRNFEGIVDLSDLPSAMFVVDTKHEAIAVSEGSRVKVPVIGLVDSNSDPTLLDYPIPGNDDAAKSIRIVVETLTEAIQNGLAQRESRRATRSGEHRPAGQPQVAIPEIDLDRVVIPPKLKELVEDEEDADVEPVVEEEATEQTEGEATEPSPQPKTEQA